jgi:hypothetical protein
MDKITTLGRRRGGRNWCLHPGRDRGGGRRSKQHLEGSDRGAQGHNIVVQCAQAAEGAGQNVTGAHQRGSGQLRATLGALTLRGACARAAERASELQGLGLPKKMPWEVNMRQG